MTLIWTADGFSPFHLSLSNSHPLLSFCLWQTLCWLTTAQPIIYLGYSHTLQCRARKGRVPQVLYMLPLLRLRVLVWEVLDKTVLCWLLWVFFFRIILEQKEKLENIRNSDGITYKCDPGLNSNQGVCPVCFQIFDEIQFGSLWRVFFSVCPWCIQRITFPCASRSSKFFSRL